jgi:hypothetical protein
VFSFCWPYPSSGLSMSMPTCVVYWVSSTTSVRLPGVISGDGISSALTTPGNDNGCCSLPCDCIYAMVLTLGCLVVWLSSDCFGGAMVVKFDHPLILVASAPYVNFALCFICSIALCLFQFLNKIFSPTSLLCTSVE